MNILDLGVRKGRDKVAPTISSFFLLPTLGEEATGGYPYPSWLIWGDGGGCATSSEGKWPDSGLLGLTRAIRAIPLPLGDSPVLAC